MTPRTITRIALPIALLLYFSGVGGHAHAHEIETKISVGGLGALGPAIASQIPEALQVPTIETSLFECSGEDASITIQSREVSLEVHDLELSQPQPGQLELQLQFSASTAGEVDFHRVVFCGSTFTCQDSLAMQNVGARVVLETQSTEDGLESLVVVDVELDIDADRFDLSLSGCDYADLANTLVDLVETVGVSMLANLVEKLVRDNLTPAIVNAASGISDSSLNLLRWQLGVAVRNLDLGSGIRVQADADLVSDQPVASCLQDPGEPQPHTGTPPLLASDTDLEMSINLGLVDDLLYHMWASASQCPGLVSDAQFIGDHLPNFPAGSVWRLEATLRSPPFVAGTAGTAGTANDDVALEVVFRDIQLVLEATLPNGSTRRATLALDARAGVELGVDSSASAIALGLRDARVTRLLIDDELSLEAQGFDAAHVTQFLNDVYLPAQLATYLEADLRLPLAFGVGRTHLIVREIQTNSAFLSLGLDFFTAPLDDTKAPETVIVSAPAVAVRYDQAYVYLAGTDTQIPSELLRYQVEVNGVEMPLARSSRIQVGLQNHTATYNVAIAAVDLAGNVDPSPSVVAILVDGIRPTVTVEHQISEGEIEIDFLADDDRTDSSRLRAQVEIRDAANGSEVESRQLPAGAHSLRISALDPARSYRVRVVVTDEVGNEGASSFLIPAASVGGCSASGGAASSSALLLLLLLMLAGLEKGRRGRKLVLLVGLLGAGCADSGGQGAGDARAIMLPECASEVAVQMWSEMQDVAGRSTISMQSAVGRASRVDPQLYIDGPEIFSKWAALIEEAQFEVDMQFYKWEPETDATETILAGIRSLQDRRRDDGASEPIVVRIVIDTSALGVAAPATEEHMPWVMERIEAYRIDPRYVDLRFFVVERGFLNQFGNLHVKTMVVDGRVAIITGANPEHQHDFDKPWHDLATVFYGDIVRGILDDIDYTHRDAQQWVCSSHSAERSVCLVESEPYAHKEATEPLPVVPNTCAVLALSRTPSVTANNSVENPQDQAFLAAFNSATRVIKLETPNINDDAVKGAILEAVKRGVEVRLITSKGFNETSEGFVGGPNGENISELYRDLALLGVNDPCSKLQVRWYSRDGLEPIVGNGAYASHTKYSSIDDQVVIVGTTNMDTASWNFSHELNLAVDDTAMAQKLNAQLFDADWGKAVVVEECRDF